MDTNTQSNELTNKYFYSAHFDSSDVSSGYVLGTSLLEATRVAHTQFLFSPSMFAIHLSEEGVANA